MLTYNQVKGSAEFIMAQTRVRPKIAIILGTGQSSIASEIEGAVRIPYKNIPRWNATTQKSHEGCIFMRAIPLRSALIPLRCSKRWVLKK